MHPNSAVAEALRGVAESMVQRILAEASTGPVIHMGS
jgi:hypothetical protein